MIENGDCLRSSLLALLGAMKLPPMIGALLGGFITSVSDERIEEVMAQINEVMQAIRDEKITSAEQLLEIAGELL